MTECFRISLLKQPSFNRNYIGIHYKTDRLGKNTSRFDSSPPPLTMNPNIQGNDIKFDESQSKSTTHLTSQRSFDSDTSSMLATKLLQKPILQKITEKSSKNTFLNSTIRD